MRIFFKGLRLLLKPFMLLWAQFSMPNGIVRPTSLQQSVDADCAKLALYHFSSCPFCIKVRREMARLSLPIQLREAQQDAKNQSDLLLGGGKIQTPCLQIVDEQGNIKWLYESNDIIKYLQHRFP